MSFLNLGYVLLGIGLAIAIGGGGVPPFGFRTGFQLLMEWKQMKAIGKEPTLDQKGAYYTFLSYGVAAVFILLGCLFLIVGKVIGE